jgi:hypothetical protein
VKLIGGWLLDDRDGATEPPAVVINEAAANRVFGDRDVIGHIAFWAVRWAIVGIVGDEKFHALAETTPDRHVYANRAGAVTRRRSAAGADSWRSGEPRRCGSRHNQRHRLRARRLRHGASRSQARN